MTGSWACALVSRNWRFVFCWLTKILADCWSLKGLAEASDTRLRSLILPAFHWVKNKLFDVHSRTRLLKKRTSTSAASSPAEIIEPWNKILFDTKSTKSWWWFYQRYQMLACWKQLSFSPGLPQIFKQLPRATCCLTRVVCVRARSVFSNGNTNSQDRCEVWMHCLEVLPRQLALLLRNLVRMTPSECMVAQQMSVSRRCPLWLWRWHGSTSWCVSRCGS